MENRGLGYSLMCQGHLVNMKEEGVHTENTKKVKIPGVNIEERQSV